MTRPHETAFAGLIRLFDLLVVGGGLWAVCRALGMEWTQHYAMATAWSVSFYVGAAEGRGLYRSWRIGGLRQEAVQIVLVWSTMALGMLVLGYVTKTSAEFSRRVLLSWCIGGPLVLVASRAATRFLARRLRTKGSNQRTAAIVGAGTLGIRVAEIIRSEPWMGIRLAGFYDDRSRLMDTLHVEPPLRVLGTLDDLVDRACDGKLDVIYLALPMRAEARIKELLHKLSSTPVSVYFVPDVLAFALLRSRWFTLGAIPTVSLFETPLAGFERLLKYAMDMALAVLILVLVAPPMCLIALAIKLTSPGPVIFKQRRHGLDGREIVVWKFRTMTVCENGADFRQARRGDPRVTPLGAFLRALSLDELPQLINVLQGRMSIVGPRPHPVRLNEQHRELVDWYMLRQRVKPGLTGWAQVNGFRGETATVEGMRRRVEYDLEYIRNWSIWLDLKIIGRTFFTVFDRTNVY